MRGLDPRIHPLQKRWIAGSSPAMTELIQEMTGKETTNGV
jgi:hypothetical protein